MDFGALNMPLTVPRVPEVSQLQHNMTQQGAQQYDYEALRLKEDSLLKEQQVRGREKMEDGRVKDDANGRSHGRYQGQDSKNRSTQEEEPEKMAIDTYRGRNIDIQF